MLKQKNNANNQSSQQKENYYIQEPNSKIFHWKDTISFKN